MFSLATVKRRFISKRPSFRSEFPRVPRRRRHRARHARRDGFAPRAVDSMSGGATLRRFLPCRKSVRTVADPAASRGRSPSRGGGSATVLTFSQAGIGAMSRRLTSNRQRAARIHHDVHDVRGVSAVDLGSSKRKDGRLEMKRRLTVARERADLASASGRRLVIRSPPRRRRPLCQTRERAHEQRSAVVSNDGR